MGFPFTLHKKKRRREKKSNAHSAEENYIGRAVFKLLVDALVRHSVSVNRLKRGRGRKIEVAGLNISTDNVACAITTSIMITTHVLSILSHWRTSFVREWGLFHIFSECMQRKFRKRKVQVHDKRYLPGDARIRLLVANIIIRTLFHFLRVSFLHWHTGHKMFYPPPIINYYAQY